MKFRRGHLAFALLFWACGSKPEAPDPAPAKAPSELRCQAAVTRACPCLGGGQGMQTCADSGRAFGPCMPCSPSAGASGAAAAGGSGSSGSSGATSAGAGGRATSGKGAGGAAGAGRADAGRAGAAVDPGADPGTVEPGSPDHLSAARGIACGVGLPVLCDLASQKCCKRSLSLDTCIPVAMACECEQDSCETLEARCDGPEDCAQGQQCCAGGSGRNAYTGFSCAASCSSTSRQACHADGDCPAQLTCAISQILATVSVCTDPKSLEQ